ncbi:MAG: glycosyltransferase family 39 protein, partial [Candidatus Hydrogenedentes bacterium]|nr:glycosyltransferase family 39 protein [Candidatus Hydrogenedentota bacterium]
MSFTYPQQPMPPYGGEGAPSVSPQGWQSVPPPQPAPPLVSPQPQLPPVTPHEKGDMEGMALLTVVIIFHVLFNIYWLHADTHLIHLDEAHHIGRAAAYYDALFPIEKTGLFERGVAALNVESPYPPLTHLVGAVFIRVLGYSPDSIAFSGSLFLGLFLIGVYLFARQGVSARNAFLAALLAGFMPMTFASSRYFMPDLLLAALVAWALYALLKSDRFRKTSWVVLFALFAGLAFLTKQIAFVYLLFPVLWIFLWGSFSAVYPARGDGVPLKRSRAAQLLFNMLLCIFIVLGVCSWWYTRHVEYMYTWWSTQRGGEIGLLQPGIASHIKFAMPENGEDAESSIYLDPAISRLTVKIKDETTDTKEVAAPEETTAQNLIPITPEKETSSLLVSVTPEGEMGNLLAPIAPEGESAKTLEGETETE